MDVSRLDRGLLIVGASGLVLFISLFLPWYGVSASIGGSAKITVNASAWKVFTYSDLLLFLISVVAVGAAAATAADKLPALPVPLAQIVLGAGALGVLIVVFRLLDIPGDSGGVLGIDVGRKLGIFVGLIAAGGIVYGGTQTATAPV